MSVPIAVLLLYDFAVVRDYVEREIARRSTWADIRRNLSVQAVPGLRHRDGTVRDAKPVAVGIDEASTSVADRGSAGAVVTGAQSLSPPPQLSDGGEVRSVGNNTDEVNKVHAEENAALPREFEAAQSEEQNETHLAVASDRVDFTEQRDERLSNATKVREASVNDSVRPEEADSTTPEVPANEYDVNTSISQDGATWDTRGKADAAQPPGNAKTQVEDRSTHGTSQSADTPEPRVVMVVLAIPDGYPQRAEIASRSHAAYARRHGYRLVVQRDYLGNSTEGRRHAAVSLQKLLVHDVLRDEEYAAVVDYDVVIAPWAPPLPLSSLGGGVGIVDEAQPSLGVVTAVLRYRTGRTRVPSEYYRSMGFPAAPRNGLLNTGVLLAHRRHAPWMAALYRRHVRRVARLPPHVSFHYEQALIGAELMRRDLVATLPHAWNRNWMWYNYSHLVGGERYHIGDVFRRSYFLHFLWAKQDMPKLDEWMMKNNVTFDPAPYATDVLP